MVLQRVWNFVKRHKKKCIAGGVIVGGGYVAYRYFLPKLQERLLEKLLAEAGGTFQELAKEASAAKEEASAGRKKKRDARFRHRQQVSDVLARKALSRLRERLTALFRIEDCKAKLSTPGITAEQKAAHFRELEIECVARAISATYSLNLLMLLCRVQTNIASRDMAAESKAQPVGPAVAAALETSSEEGAKTAKEVDAHEMFLTSTDYLEETGIKHVADVVRRIVTSHIETTKILPATAVSAESLEKFFLDISSDVVGETLKAGEEGCLGSALVLPEKLDSEIAGSDAKIKALLDETRDYLESPQFAEALRAVFSAATKRLVGTLGDGAADASKAPLADGKSQAMARLFGPILEMSNMVLNPGEGNEFVAQFAQDAVVSQLCEALFAQDAADGEDEDAKCPQQ
eukprot:TRINITY_DN90293_c0_g1_i1.p1 TRINITY_DN90293_c0_g1~~TRINITY_DN90293_c0_g1_i1.p1  ORF type:complete len:404 (-),score=136.67 TRINITY_DN90293_c0_g1_i1:37-1248(-)